MKQRSTKICNEYRIILNKVSEKSSNYSPIEFHCSLRQRYFDYQDTVSVVTQGSNRYGFISNTTHTGTGLYEIYGPPQLYYRTTVSKTNGVTELKYSTPCKINPTRSVLVVTYFVLGCLTIKNPLGYHRQVSFPTYS